MGEILQTAAGQKVALKWREAGCLGQPVPSLIHDAGGVYIRLARHAEQTHSSALVAPISYHLPGR